MAWSLAAMMSFTLILGIFLTVYMFCLVQSLTQPHEMEQGAH
jgi:hypothetical protein